MTRRALGRGLSALLSDQPVTAANEEMLEINIDLIAGMMGETEEKWRDAVRRAIELEPDSVTIYQMELPYNTVISQDILKKGAASPIAGWVLELT